MFMHIGCISKRYICLESNLRFLRFADLFLWARCLRAVYARAIKHRRHTKTHIIAAVADAAASAAVSPFALDHRPTTADVVDHHYGGGGDFLITLNHMPENVIHHVMLKRASKRGMTMKGTYNRHKT